MKIEATTVLTIESGVDPFLAKPAAPEQSYWPEKLTLSQIAEEQDDTVQMCLLIMYSKFTSTWEKNFARDNATKQVWKLVHHWIVPPEQRVPSQKVFDLLKKICRDHGLDKIDLQEFTYK